MAGAFLLLLFGYSYSVFNPTSNVDACALPAGELEQAIAAEATTATNVFLSTPGYGRYVIPTTACRWNCAARPGSAPATCLSNLHGLLKYNCPGQDRQLGMSELDVPYVKTAGDKFGGKFMRPPEIVVDAAVNETKMEAFKKILDQHGYRYLEFASTSISNFPDGPERILVLVETPDYDQWIQIANPPVRPKVLGQNIDFLAVEKRDPITGRSLVRPNMYFNGMRRGIVAGQLLQEGEGTKFELNRCYSCHPSGLRGIYPRAGSVPPEQEPTLAYFQKKIAQSPPMSFGGYYEPHENGPAAGAVDPPDRLAFISRTCAIGLPPARRAKVAKAMNCASCHDGQYRGILNAGTDFGTIRHKIVNVEPAAIMPPGSDLDTIERDVAYRCLKLEYAEQLRGWITRHTCRASDDGSSSCDKR